MDFLPSEEQRAIRKMVQDFARHQITPYACGWEEREEFPRETFRALAALGLGGMLCPREYGGLGLDHLTAAMVYEELGKAYQGLCFLAIHNMVGSLLGQYGNEAQKLRWLPPLIRGDLLAAFACTEPSAGSDIAAMESTAVPQGDCYLLSGNKVFITSAGEAEVYLVAARTGGTISLFVIEKGTPGLRFGKAERKMGLRSVPHCQIFFQDCPVPREDRLGEEGKGLELVLEALDSSRVEVGAFAVGLAEAALAKE